jgi:hypothetical protein
MDRIAAQRLIEAEMAKHGLADWAFGLDFDWLTAGHISGSKIQSGCSKGRSKRPAASE